MTADTVFRIYSMTKPVTSAAVMILVEEGAVDLDDPVATFLPEFEGLRRYVSGTVDDMVTEDAEIEMTVRDLLRHTSGLTYGFFGNTPVDQAYRRASIGGPEDDLQTLVEKLGAIPLLFEPGQRWVYSLATDVLGRVVEVAAEQPYDEFLAERIFEPLAMIDTSFAVPTEKQVRFASSYGPSRRGGLQLVDDRDTSRFAEPAVYFSGGGGLLSTASDYLRFCQMMINGGELDGVRILEEETVFDMTRDQLPGNVKGVFGNASRGFGLGFSVQLTGRPGTREGEYGWGGAASTHFWICPKEELVVVALSQIQPQSMQLELTIKPMIYDAILDAGD